MLKEQQAIPVTPKQPTVSVQVEHEEPAPSAEILDYDENKDYKAVVVTTGFSRLDALTSGFQNSDLVIIAGRPAMGKTAFALNMARNAAIEGNVPVAIFSLEMSKEQLSMRMLCAEARVDSSRIRSGFLNKEDWNRITDAAGRLTEAPVEKRAYDWHSHLHVCLFGQ